MLLLPAFTPTPTTIALRFIPNAATNGPFPHAIVVNATGFVRAQIIPSIAVLTTLTVSHSTVTDPAQGLAPKSKINRV